MAHDAEGHHIHEELSHHEGDEQGAAVVGVVTLVICIIVAITVVVVISGVQWWTEKEIERKLDVQHPARVALQAYEHEALSGYTWFDREKNTVRVPIDRGMEMLLQERGAER
jgi:hypothetical protein